MDSRSPAEALRAAVDAVGSQSAMGRLLGVSQAAVWRWLDRAHHLPAEHVLTVEAATGISKHVLRPDVYPYGMPSAPTASIGIEVPQ
jgi:DNA-binding transcriptional regulator YdaS (Cro superfamily)